MSSQKDKNHVCLEVSEIFPLSKYTELLLQNQSDSGKLDEPHGGTNHPVSLGNSKHGNSVIISDCQVSSGFEPGHAIAPIPHCN